MRSFAIAVTSLIGTVAWVFAVSFVPGAGPAVSFAQEVTQPAVHTAAVQPGADAAKSAATEPAKAEPAKSDAPATAALPAVTYTVDPVAPPAAEPATTASLPDAAAPPAKAPAAMDKAPAATAALPDVTYPIDPVAPEAKPAQETAQPTQQADASCPGHPDALGTSRVITIQPGEYQELGVINYKQTLPLKDHEVVLTFDDGPIPPYTNSVLDTLAANCVKATYFLVGEMAAPRPYLVRRIYNEGHSIGTHSQHHPFAFQRLSMARVESEVDGGIASVDGALGDPKALSPFFRIPGFGRSNAIDSYLEHKGLVTWSADVDTDDWWRGTTPHALIERTMRRLNARGRGIILMHDIHPDTALALPELLKQLKANGYHVVHVVFAGERPKSLPEVVATPLEKENWPRVLHTIADKGGPAKAALRRRVKLALESHHRGRHHVAARTGSAQSDTTAATDRMTRSY